MKRQVTCDCGAVYERTEEKLTFRDSDSFQCSRCGNTLEILEWFAFRCFG